MKFFFCILSLLGLLHYLQVTNMLALFCGSLAWNEFCSRLPLSEMPVPKFLWYIALFVIPPFFYLSCLTTHCVRLSRLVRKRLFIGACVGVALFMPLLLRSFPAIPRDICVLLVLWAISLWFERKAVAGMPEGGGESEHDSFRQ